MKRTPYLLTILILLTACTGCDNEKLKPGEFEDAALKACVQEKIDYDANLGLLDKNDPELYNKITRLGCGGGAIRSLKGIENMPNIDDLGISNNQIESLEPLRAMTKLKSLNLNNNKIEDLEPVSQLPLLGILALNDNYVSDITSLYEMEILGYLEMANNCVPKEQFLTLKEKNPDLNLGVDLENYVIPEKCQ